MFNDGFEAGLRYWLVFLLAFFFLGYPVPLSIFWGGIAGIAGGFLAAYWRAKEIPKTAAPEDDGAASKPFRGITHQLERWRRQQLERTGRSPIVSNWFGRRPKRTLRDRRK